MSLAASLPLLFALQTLADFGSNPGRLEAFVAVPSHPAAAAPLVVALHGCTMSAAEMHERSGLAELCEEAGVFLLYPQQTTSNNSMRCFNWFLPENQSRESGESLSVKQMVDAMMRDHSIDPGRVFVLGLSAGGAFAANLLAAWPEVFAAGAIMAGVPARCASSLTLGQACQAGSVDWAPDEWARLVREASPAHAGPYPRIALFHGSADTVVAPSNLRELVEQWTAVHGIPPTPTSSERLSGQELARYERDGAVLVEALSIAGMGHGMAVGPSDPVRPCGRPGQWFEDRGLCAAYASLSFFGIAAAADGGIADGAAQPDGHGGGGCAAAARTSASPVAASILAWLALRVSKRRREGWRVRDNEKAERRDRTL